MRKEFRITLNGKEYHVVAEMSDDDFAMEAPAPRSRSRFSQSRSAPAAPAPAQAAAPKATVSADGDVPSPLAGKVVAVDAPVGTAVKAGDTIITLEAMKMNTVVSAPADGTVKAVHVEAGDAVEEGQPLLTIA